MTMTVWLHPSGAIRTMRARMTKGGQGSDSSSSHVPQASLLSQRAWIAVVVMVGVLGPAAEALAGWTEQVSNSPQLLFTVHAVSDEVAWAVGDGGQVVVTADGGSNWLLRPVPGALGLRGLFAFDDQLCLVADQLGRFWRTTNGGLIWSLVQSGPVSSINGIHFFDDYNGWAMGDPVEGHFFIIETSDGGLTWISSPNPPPASGVIGFVHSFDWVGTEIGVFGTNYWVIWRTTNGGAQWDSVRTHLQYIPGLVLDNSGIGLAGGNVAGNEDIRLDRSTDFGESWNVIESPKAGLLTFAWIGGTNEVWGLTSQAGLFQSINSGLDWVRHVLAPQFEFVAEDVDFADSGTGWCVGRNTGVHTGRIFKYTRDSTGIVNDQSAEMTAKVWISPNPFDTDVSFRFKLSGGAPVEISIYDIKGRILRHAHLMSTQGMSQYRWNGLDKSGRAVANGIYLYRVSNGRDEITGRMIKVR